MGAQKRKDISRRQGLDGMGTGPGPTEGRQRMRLRGTERASLGPGRRLGDSRGTDMPGARGKSEPE